jgi:hypothetical protein
VAAAARTPYCHFSERALASGIAEPRIAPIAAGPAPSRKAFAFTSARIRSKRSPPARMKANEGENATSAARRPPPTPAAPYPTTATVCVTGPGVT